MEQLVRLIDDHTEYFRSHLEGFAKTERRVYLATVDLWQPSTAGEIAARARLDIRTVSPMLGRLVHRGAVISEGAGRRRRYSASERLYTIYYKLRRERDEAAVVSNLIRFMAVFYSHPELADMSEKLSVEPEQSPAIRDGIERTIAEATRSDGTISPDKLFIIEQVRNQAMKSIAAERAKARYIEVLATATDGNYEQVIMLVDRFLKSRDDESLRSSTTFVDLMVSAKLLAQAEIGDDIAAVAAYEEIVDRFSASEVPAVEAAAAMALFNIGNSQSRLDDHHGAISTYKQVVSKYGAGDSPALQVQVAKSLFNTAITCRRIGDFDAEVATYQDVANRYGSDKLPQLQIWVARSLVNLGNAQGRLGNPQQAVATYKEVVCTHGPSDSPELCVQVAIALLNMGVTQSQLGNLSEGKAAYADVVKRYGASKSPQLQAQVAKALFARGIAQAQLGDNTGEVAAYEAIVCRYGSSDSPELRVQVATALVNKGFIQIMRDREADALRTCEVLESYGSLTDPNDIPFGWWTAWLRTKALLRLGRQTDAMEAYRSTYAEFRTTGATMSKLLKLSLELIAAGAPERDLLAVMASDREKAASLAPLVVALRIRSGEEVRAPAQVMEVAEDILKQVDTEL